MRRSIAIVTTGLGGALASFVLGSVVAIVCGSVNVGANGGKDGRRLDWHDGRLCLSGCLMRDRRSDSQ